MLILKLISGRIVEKPVVFPGDTKASPAAQDLIRSLCTVDRSKRLGNISGGASRVKSHSFFEEINWEDLLNRRQRGPIVPPVRYAGDAQCFDTYPEDGDTRDPYSSDMAKQYDQYFQEF